MGVETELTCVRLNSLEIVEVVETETGMVHV